MMKKNPDKTTTLTEAEMKSLKKVIKACSNLLAQLPSSGEDLLGASYYALGMWEDKLEGRSYELSWYIDEEDEEESSKKKKKPTTVDAWLEAYGKAR